MVAIGLLQVFEFLAHACSQQRKHSVDFLMFGWCHAWLRSVVDGLGRLSLPDSLEFAMGCPYLFDPTIERAGSLFFVVAYSPSFILWVSNLDERGLAGFDDVATTNR